MCDRQSARAAAEPRLLTIAALRLASPLSPSPNGSFPVTRCASLLTSAVGANERPLTGCAVMIRKHCRCHTSTHTEQSVRRNVGLEGQEVLIQARSAAKELRGAERESEKGKSRKERAKCELPSKTGEGSQMQFGLDCSWDCCLSHACVGKCKVQCLHACVAVVLLLRESGNERAQHRSATIRPLSPWDSSSSPDC